MTLDAAGIAAFVLAGAYSGAALCTIELGLSRRKEAARRWCWVSVALGVALLACVIVLGTTADTERS